VRFLRGLPREVGVLTAVSFSVAVGFGIVAPAIPVFAREFGVSRTAAGAVISVFAFMRLIFALAGGQLVDRLGERRVLAAGIGIVAVSSALAGLAQTYTQLLLLRGVGGVGSAMFTVAAVSLLLRVVGPDQRGRATGMFQAGFLIGGVSGPALGGVLTTISLRLPFFVYAAMLAVAGAIAMLALAHTELAEDTAGEGTAGDGPDGQPQRTSLGTALRDRSYLAALVANLGLGWAVFGLRISLIPLFVVEGLRRDPVWTGIGLVAGSAAQALALLPAGRITDTVGRRPAMLIGSFGTAASLALLALSTSVAPYVVAMVLFGLGAAFLGVAPAAVVGDVVRGRGGTVVAAFQMASDLGAVAGPVLAGWLADEVSFAAAWGVSAAVVAVGGLAALAVPTRPRADAARA